MLEAIFAVMAANLPDGGGKMKMATRLRKFPTTRSRIP